MKVKVYMYLKLKVSSLKALRLINKKLSSHRMTSWI